MRTIRIRKDAQCWACGRWYPRGTEMMADGERKRCQYACPTKVSAAEAAQWLADLAESRDAQREVEELDVKERKGVA